MPVDPPASRREPALAERLSAALAARGPAHAPRTHHLEPGGVPRYVNRLILEASPYLLQHAHNPVDWRPWGAAALAEAAARDVPGFLSVGYATCHWCHVMEEESFDDEAVAAALNARFVPVKLDREERPDLDQIYILATQLQHGHAGWPNSLWLRPDGAPFHTGTYFRKADFLRVLEAVSEAWATRRGEIDGVAGRIAAAVERQGRPAEGPAAPPDAPVFAAAVAGLSAIRNRAHGGFSEGRQFPQETFLLFLLDRWRRDGDAEAWEIAAATLDAIAAGGIHDHAGGGFHRYTVDVDWRTPHFEKMLYNQGLLGRAFVEGWEASGNPAWRRAAERCFAYLLRDMTDAAGCFFAAEDADSLDGEGRRTEGAFYAWTPEAARAALGEAAGRGVALLGLDAAPRIEAGSVPHLRPGEALPEGLDALLERLRRAREARPRPIRDEKVIAGWNGLTIRALAEGAAAFGRPDLLAAAARAGDALWDRLWDGTRLHRLWAGGGPRGEGQLEDHVWLGLAFLAIDEAAALLGAEAAGPRWAERAGTLARATLARFADGAGRLRMAAEPGPLGDVYETADGATPAGESSALEFLARIGDPEAARAAADLAAAIAPPMREVPLLRLEAMAGARRLADGPSALRRTLAGGALRLALRRPESAAGPWRLDIALAPGWHLAAPDPGAAGLAGARAEGAAVHWPDARTLRLGAVDRPLRAYEGRLTVALAPHAPEVALHLQVCSDQLCAEPVAARFRVARPLEPPLAPSGETP